MKKIGYILITTILSVFFVSCDKWPENTTLEGQWQLVSIERDGAINNVKQDLHFWNLQIGMIQFETGKPLAEINSETDGFAYYKYRNDSLIIYKMCDISAYVTNTDDNVPMTEERVRELLPMYGIDIKDESFRVVQLSDEHMTLNHGTKTLNFVKR